MNIAGAIRPLQMSLKLYQSKLLSINTNQSNRNHLPIPDPIETQLPIEIVEPQRSRPPTPDTIASVDGQQKGIRSNSSPSTTNIIIFLPFFDDNCCITNFMHYFSFYVHEPPAPEALRGALQNVDSICNLLQTSSIVDELPGKVPWCFCIFSVNPQHCFNYLL